jgi:hypothetical protein
LRPTLDPLARESGLRERPLLGDVLDIGLRLDAIGLGPREQVVGQEPLGLAAIPVPA